jgi:DNA modification methylase
VLWRPTGQVHPYERNPRRCSEEAVHALAASIAEFGWQVPLVIDEQGTIVAGHTRYRAAHYLDAKTVPVVVASELSPAQIKAFRVADNKLGELTSRDPLLLEAEIRELVGMDVDPALTGFSAEELAALLAPPPTAGLSDPDEIIEPPAEPVTKPGDLWLCGDHRLLCGDSTNAADVARLMNGRRAELIACDSPYVIGYSGGSHPQSWHNKAATRDKDWSADYREAEVGSAQAFFASFISVAIDCAARQDAAWYLWHAGLRQPDLQAAMRACGLLVHQQIIWVKSRAVLTHSHYLWAHEGCLYAWLEGHPPRLRPPAEATTVWQIASKTDDGARGLNPCQKPIETARRPIVCHTRPGGLVVDLFVGSGTTLIACEELGRVCFAMEISPAFCDAARLRWERFAGTTATLEVTS